MFTATLTSWTAESLRSLTYDDDQRTAIDVVLAEIAKVTPQDYVRYDRSSKLVDCGHGVVFAIVGDQAFEIPRMSRSLDPTGKSSDIVEYKPVVVHGQCVIETSDQGRTKMLILMRKTHPSKPLATDKWFPIFMNAEPLAAADIEAAPEAMGARIAGELPSGSFSFPTLKDLGLS